MEHLEYLRNLKKREIMAGFGIACLFLLASFGSDRFSDLLRSYIGSGGAVSMATYVAMVMMVITIPFATSLPLVPIAATVWGNVAAALLTFVGWMCGLSITFFIGRRLGKKFLRNVINVEGVESFSAMIPKKHFLLSIMLFGLFSAPVDVVSYAVGIFTRLRFLSYFVAFGAGLLPSAFFISYTSTLSLMYQTYIVGFMVIVWLFLYARLKEEKRKNGART